MQSIRRNPNKTFGRCNAGLKCSDFKIGDRVMLTLSFQSSSVIGVVGSVVSVSYRANDGLRVIVRWDDNGMISYQYPQTLCKLP